jgi:kynureninase
MPAAESDVAALRSEFPGLDERRYFVTHSFGPIPREALADLEDYRQVMLLRRRGIARWAERIEECTTLLEQLLGAPPKSMALRESATSAQAAIAASLLPRSTKNRIVVATSDFPSSRYLWQAQVARGFEIVELSPSAELSPLPVVTAEEFVASIDERTAVVATSLVSPWTGALLDAARVVRAARAFGAIVVLDAYQAVGVVPIDVGALGADVVVGGTHKWLSGGDTGLAFLYVSPSLAERLDPVYPGWFGHVDPTSFAPTFCPAPGARRFQQGSPAMEPTFTARAGLRCVLAAGIHKIRRRSLELTSRLMARCGDRGLRVLTPQPEACRGGTICVDVRAGDTVSSELEKRGIDVDYRPRAGVRVSPHFCQTEAECDEVIDAIAELRRKWSSD